MTTATLDDPRSRLLQHLDANESDHFLTLAAPYLAFRPDDDYTRLMAVREYLKLGLVEPARELLNTPSFLPPELAEIRTSLAGLSGGRIAWSTFDDRFESNLRVLQGRGVDVAPIRRAWQQRSLSLECFRDRRGIEQVRHRDENGTWRWIPFLGDHRAEDHARPLPEGIDGLMPGPYLFDGLGLGAWFERVYQATLNTFLGYSCALFVVEPDPLWIALVLHLRDWTILLEDKRIFWLMGSDGTHQLMKLWESDLDLPFPDRVFSLNGFRPSASPDPVSAVQHALKLRADDVHRSTRKIVALYADRDLRHWATRFEQALSGEGDPLRILAAVSSHTTFLKYSMRDAKRALKALGHQCLVLTEKENYAKTGPLAYHNAIRTFEPDLFFCIDHLRPEFGEVIPPNLPLLTWDQDQLPHVFTEANLAGIGPLDFIVGYSKGRCVDAGCDPRQFLNARVPTCPEQFSGPDLTDEETARYACDLSYVSHASQTPEAFHREQREQQRDADIKHLLDYLFERAPEMMDRHGVLSSAVAEVMIDEAAGQGRMEPRNEELRRWLINWYLWRLGDRMFRHQALTWAADWARRGGHTFRIHGNGWDKHPTLAPFAAGPAQNGRELLCIYRASRINLQLMPAGFLHQRSLDGLAAGGFFLSRATPHDLKGKLLRRLITRMDELNIGNTRELLTCEDETLRQLLQDYHGPWLSRIDPYKNDLYGKLRILAELDHPEEVFPRFRDILFASAEEFAELADRYGHDDEQRRRITRQMRKVVVKRFSYRSTMDRFLRAMTNYLKSCSP